MLHHTENLFIKYHEQIFSIKCGFSGQYWTRLSIKQCKKCQFLGCLLKASISVLFFSTESAKDGATAYKIGLNEFDSS